MFKKKVMALLAATLLAFTSFSTAFAVAGTEEIGIAPYDSNFIVSIPEGQFVLVSNVSVPLLGSKDVSVSSFYGNPGAIIIQGFDEAGIMVGESVLIEPGEVGTVTIDADFGGALTGESISLFATAQVAGPYRIVVSEGNLGQGLVSQYLFADSSQKSVLYRDTTPYLFGKDLVIENHPLSPGSAVVQIVNASSGAVIVAAETIEPGESHTFSIPASLSNVTFNVEAYAESVEDFYHFNITY